MRLGNLCRNPAGPNPARQSWVSSRKRVLSRVRELPGRSGDSQAKRSAIESRNGRRIARAFVVVRCGGRVGSADL